MRIPSTGYIIRHKTNIKLDFGSWVADPDKELKGYIFYYTFSSNWYTMYIIFRVNTLINLASDSSFQVAKVIFYNEKGEGCSTPHYNSMFKKKMLFTIIYNSYVVLSSKSCGRIVSSLCSHLSNF